MKNKPLSQCKTTKDLASFAESNGIHRLRTSGGHAIYGNSRGSFPLSTHDKELSKGIAHAIRKQILSLLGVILIFVIIVRFVA